MELAQADPPRYRELRPLLRWLQALLVLALFMGWMGILLELSQLWIIRRIEDGRAPWARFLEFHAMRYLFGRSLQALLWGGAGALFLAWLVRARKNLDSLGLSDLRYSPTDCLSAWLIPVVQLYRPYLVVREVYRRSDPGLESGVGIWLRRLRRVPIVGIWWTCFVTALAIVGVAVVVFAFELPVDARIAARIAMAADIASIPTAFTMIVLTAPVGPHQRTLARGLHEVFG